MKLEYPFNLAKAIFGEGEWDKLYIPNLQDVLEKLTDREQGILKFRFREGMTLEQCAKSYGVTRERIRQIESKAIRKLQHPQHKCILTSVSLAESRKQHKELDEKWRALYAENQALSKEYQKVITTLESLVTKIKTPEAVVESLNDVPLDDLEFSIRTYNCLRRAGKNTLKDITEMTEDELTKVRNLGAKSIREVKDTLRQKGLSLRGYESDTI